MGKKLKVVTVVGTRPEIIRLSRVLCKLDLWFDHVLIHTGQNYDRGLNEIFFDDLQIRPPQYVIEAGKNSSSYAESIGRILSNVHDYLVAIRPDAFLVLGDTNSCLSAITAKRLRIPVFHMEAGNRCFDDRVPEEVNRRLVDNVSDINLCYSRHARDNLLKEGFAADNVIVTGSPMNEVLRFYRPKIDRSEIMDQLGVEAGQYFVCSFHREENLESPRLFEAFKTLLLKLAENYQLPVIVSCHPRLRIKLEKSSSSFPSAIRFMTPLSFSDYIKLQENSKIVFSDSGTISEEAAILGFKAINLRETHERPEAMEEASVIMTGLNINMISNAIDVLLGTNSSNTFPQRIPYDYQVGNVSDKIVKIIISYIDYIKRTKYCDLS